MATETELPNGFAETTGHVRLNSWVSSDPRLTGDVATDNIILVGRDGYEGLTAYILVDGREWPPTYSGVIFPSAMPAVPEPYAAE